MSDLEHGDLLERLNNLIECSINQSPEGFLQMLPAKVCDYLAVSTCILWIRDYEANSYKILAAAGKIDDEYRKTELNVNHPGVQFSSSQKVFSLRDISQEKYRLADKKLLVERGYKSLISSPLKIDQETIGILDVLTTEFRSFKLWEKKLLISIAQQTTICVQKRNLIQENSNKDHSLDSLSEKLRKLNKLMLEITNTSKIKEIYQLIIDGVLQLSPPAKVLIFRLNYQTGKLKVVKSSVQLSQNISAKYGETIIGKSLANNEPKIINHIEKNTKEKDRLYIPYWDNSQSALIIPIVIDKIQVRIGTDISEGLKAIGILLLESDSISAFNESDKELLISLARHAAIEIERIRAQKKLIRLRKLEQQIANEKNYEKIMQAVVSGITKVLKFEIANISLVNPERTHIKSEYISGVSQEKVKLFKEQADHNLNSDDIQADIVRRKIIEVPKYDDPRFDQELYKEFSHHNLIRVFMPMVEVLNDLVIGTVEAGYNRKYQEYIYEWDVQILETFVYIAVQALERRKLGWLDRITHELKSPIIGIRADASFLQRRLNQIDNGLVYIKLNDIITGAEMILFQVRQLESYWRDRNYRKEKIERVYLERDIIVKTINQLREIANERGLSIYNIITPRYKNRAIYTDKIKLNQIIYNLLINAIKYAHNEPEKFKIIIEVEPSAGDLIRLRFKDWGIGINEEYGDKVFDEGFREPVAIHKNVTGSGLGLFISKAIAKELRGDLELVNLFHPTEFLLTIYNHKF